MEIGDEFKYLAPIAYTSSQECDSEFNPGPTFGCVLHEENGQK